MTKRFVFLSILFIAVFLVLIFVTVTKTEQVTIRASYYTVYQNLANASNWVKWFPNFKQEDFAIDSSSENSFQIRNKSTSIKLNKVGLGAFSITIKNTRDAEYFNCVVAANKSIQKADVITVKRIRLLSWLLSFFKSPDESIINGLKQYLEDPQAYYGFLMTVSSATDQQLLVKRTTASTANVSHAKKVAWQELTRAAKELHLTVEGPFRLQYSSTSADSTQIMLGLPISKKGSNARDAEYMLMPGGKVLTGYFKGKYKDKEKLYRALYLYMNDHGMNQQTKPYEVFTGNQLPQNDETIVDMKVIVPYV